MAIAIEAPLIAAGPPGWAIIGATAVGTAAVATAPLWAPKVEQGAQNLWHATTGFIQGVEGSLGASSHKAEQAEPQPQSEPESSSDSSGKAPDAPPIPDDPGKPPGPDWEWRGKGAPGSGEGSWYNPKTGESLHPDLNHPDPVGPHWDYKAPDKTQWRVYPDGRMEPK